MKRLYPVTLFAIAFAYVEAAVVVYLRRIPIPSGIVSPSIDILAVNLPPDILATERVREAATIIILLSFSLLSGRKWWEKISFFLWSFGFWDIFYYVFLYTLIKWPKTIQTIDCLFLIPEPWIAPVYQPILASVGMILISAFILSVTSREKQE